MDAVESIMEIFSRKNFMGNKKFHLTCFVSSDSDMSQFYPE
jgi:hypothetical protein